MQGPRKSFKWQRISVVDSTEGILGYDKSLPLLNLRFLGIQMIVTELYTMTTTRPGTYLVFGP